VIDSDEEVRDLPLPRRRDEQTTFLTPPDCGEVAGRRDIFAPAWREPPPPEKAEDLQSMCLGNAFETWFENFGVMFRKIKLQVKAKKVFHYMLLVVHFMDVNFQRLGYPDFEDPETVKGWTTSGAFGAYCNYHINHPKYRLPSGYECSFITQDPIDLLFRREEFIATRGRGLFQVSPALAAGDEAMVGGILAGLQEVPQFEEALRHLNRKALDLGVKEEVFASVRVTANKAVKFGKEKTRR
jgi:hypothetical protein